MIALATCKGFKSPRFFGNLFLSIVLSVTGLITHSLPKGIEGQEGKTKLTKQGEFILSFPSELADDGVYLKKPTAISIDLFGYIHVVDSRQNRILVFSKKGELLRSIGRSGQGPGDLLAPEKICFDELNNLYVYESANGRIQLFNSKGDFIKGFKVFKYIQALKARGNRIYCACMQQEPNNPLIEILDLEGKLVGAIGNDPRIEKIEVLRRKSLDFKKFDISDSGKIWFAWEYFSWIQGFSLEGDKIAMIDLSAPQQTEWSRQNLRTFLKAPSKETHYRSVIFAIRAKGEFLYLLSSSADGAEIIRCTSDGRINLICKLKSHPKNEFYFYRDFDLINENGKLVFFVLQGYPEDSIDVYMVDEPERAKNDAFYSPQLK